jgi:Rieske Fe-S protein
MYSALGQIVLSMRDPSTEIGYALAVPDDPSGKRNFESCQTELKDYFAYNYGWFRSMAFVAFKLIEQHLGCAVWVGPDRSR